MNKRRLDDGTVLVGFELPAEVGATSVTVCGDFNDWAPHAHPMSRIDSGGFRAELTLPAGRRWRFRYLLDGERWENDWAADDYVPNGLGQDDSVVDLTDTSTLASSAADSAPSTPPHEGGPVTEVDPAMPSNTSDRSDRSVGGTGPTPEEVTSRSPGRLARWWRRVTRDHAKVS